MAKAPRKSPGVGRGENLASDEAILSALAIEVLDQQELDRIKESRKRHRSGAEKNGVALGELDYLYKHRKDTPSELLGEFKRRMHYMGAMFKALIPQRDLFVQSSASPEAQHAAMLAGRLAALEGSEPTPPANLVGEDAQIWMQAYHDAAPYRTVALKARRSEEEERVAVLSQAIKNAKEGKVTDGTGKGLQMGDAPKPQTKAEQDRAKAEADFKADNPGVRLPGESTPAENIPPAEPEAEEPEAPTPEPEAAKTEAAGESFAGPAPRGALYMLNSEEPFPSGRQAIYQDGKPNGTEDPTKYPHYDEHPMPVAGDDNFEASPEELEQQAERKRLKERQQAETPDPEDVAKAAAALKESGFAPEKPKRGSGRPKKVH